MHTWRVERAHLSIVDQCFTAKNKGAQWSSWFWLQPVALSHQKQLAW